MMDAPRPPTAWMRIKPYVGPLLPALSLELAPQPLVVMGDKLGYYRDLAAHGPTTAGALAERTGTSEPYAREWLNAQAAGDYAALQARDRRVFRVRDYDLAAYGV